ncbi:FAS1 domain-containing protein [Plasmodiophora brassicae]|uniref:FAS1 domain-containing protein n=1 Tax=Plasmodiophora brassicae TaxID=37360 RepID=A0A0G4J248_PLABS|nr:hypothetical protein PBRA_008630 [Plasmodiophora brassicae]
MAGAKLSPVVALAVLVFAAHIVHGEDPIQQCLQQHGGFTLLAREWPSRHLSGRLGPLTNVTVLAPTDGAFRQLVVQNRDLMRRLASTNVDRIVQRHVVQGRYTADDLAKLGRIRARNDDELTFQKTAPHVRVNNEANIVVPDIACGQSVIQGLDGAVVPDEIK